MRFLDLYESDNQQQNADANNGAQNKDTQNKDAAKKEEPAGDVITIDTVLGDLENFHDDRNARLKFLNKINRPGQQPDKAFTYGGDGTGKGKGGKSISYTTDVGSNQPSDDFKRIMAKIKDGHSSWKEEINDVIDNVENSNRQQYIKTYFIPKLENPAVKITATGNAKGDYRVPGTEHYRKFGQAMVFYAGKCVSKLTDADTKIGADKFKEIMQGCFGAAPGDNHEDADFLDQFKDLESKMKIDAAKNVIKSIHNAGTKDIDGIEVESYYTGVSYLINNRLFEADESGESKSGVACPKTIDEFSNNAGEALKQAKAVAEKYPKQYKLWYEKLRAAFDEGVEDYQEKERDPKIMKDGIKNPITGEVEHRNGKAWGAGGPNAFIRNNPELNDIVEKIKKGTPGCEGVGGWDIFNFGPKLILTMFDALEKGGKIYQKLCDDLGEGMRQIKRSLGATKPADFDKLIKKYADENQHNKAMEIGFSAVICALANVYKILGNGKIGQVNFNTCTFNTENSGSETVIQLRLDELKNAIAKLTKEEAAYTKWKEEEDKKHAEHIKKLEEEIKQAESNKDKPAEQQNSGGEGKPEEPKKDGISIKKDSYVKKFSLKDLLNEEEEKEQASDSQKITNKAKEELEAKKKELEKSKKKKNEATAIKLDNYIAIIDNYRQVLGLEKYIQEGYEAINTLFDPDSARDQYQEIFNKSNSEKEGNNNGEGEDKAEEESEDNNPAEGNGNNPAKPTGESKTLSSRLDKILKEYRLFEDEGETIAAEETDDPGTEGNNGVSNNSGNNNNNNNNNNNSANNNAQNDEPKIQSENPGTLDWIDDKADQPLKGVYRIFAEGKHGVRIDVSKFKELSTTDKPKEVLNTLMEMFKDLQNTLEQLATIDPIKDAIVACNKTKVEQIPGCIEVVGKKTEEKKPQQNKDQNKDGENKGKNENLEKLKEQRDTLAKMIDSSSPIMQNVIGQLNEKVQNAKDDSWLSEYQNLVKTGNEEAGKIYDYLTELCKTSKQGMDWLNKKGQAIKEGNFLVKMWMTISTAKEAGVMLDAQIKKIEEGNTEGKTEGNGENNTQNNGEQQAQAQNSSYKPVSENPAINEAKAREHTVKGAAEKLKEIEGNINFNDLLPVDPSAEIYGTDEKAATTFNNTEQKLSSIIGLGKKAESSPDKFYAMLRTLVSTTSDDNKVLQAVKKNNLPCTKCIEAFDYNPKSTNLKGNDRNIYLLYGCMRAIMACLSKLDNDTQENNERRVNGTKDISDSYIQELSPDSLINEIYKYIKGN